MTAMDLTRPVIDSSLFHIRPDVMFFDVADWIPAVARKVGIKSVYYCTMNCATVGYTLSHGGNLLQRQLSVSDTDLTDPQPGFPQSSSTSLKEFGVDISFLKRHLTVLFDCDAIAFCTFREIEGPYVAYLESQLNKPVLLAGLLPKPPASSLDQRCLKWLEKFSPGSVIYCAFGSDCILKRNQFQELIFGLELTQKPFFAALKPPIEADSTDSALPSGLMYRTHGKGMIHEGCGQQPLILKHPSVGWFLTDCGSGSLLEGMITDCQLVLLPHKGDQFINARMMSVDLKVGVLVERMENGSFTRDAIHEAIRSVTDEDSEIGKEVRRNYGELKEVLMREGLEESYMEEFVGKLHGL